MAIADDIKDLVRDTVVKAVVAQLVALIPGIGWLSFIITPIVGFFANKIFTAIEQFAELTAIDGQVSKEHEAYATAKTELQAVANKEGATDEEIQRAKKNFQDSLFTLIQFPHR